MPIKPNENDTKILRYLYQLRYANIDYLITLTGRKRESLVRRINQLIEKELDFLDTQNVQIIWQCGKLYYQQYKIYNNTKNVQVYEFLNNMDMAYAASDIIVSRAGASSVSELCIVGKPVVFIPSPNVAEDHQTKNAMAIVNNDAALIIKEEDLDADFENKLSQLIVSPERQKQLGENIKQLAKPNAANEIAEIILGEMGF